jgi:hypothetical protein
MLLNSSPLPLGRKVAQLQGRNNCGFGKGWRTYIIVCKYLHILIFI